MTPERKKELRARLSAAPEGWHPEMRELLDALDRAERTASIALELLKAESADPEMRENTVHRLLAHCERLAKGGT